MKVTALIKMITNGDTGEHGYGELIKVYILVMMLITVLFIQDSLLQMTTTQIGMDVFQNGIYKKVLMVLKQLAHLAGSHLQILTS